MYWILNIAHDKKSLLVGRILKIKDEISIFVSFKDRVNPTSDLKSVWQIM